MKFLIDECLSPELADLAAKTGYPESSCVLWRGLSGTKDWKLKDIILDGDWTFVTKNSIDFRGPAIRPGSKGQYKNVELHAGLVCLNCSEGMDLDLQLELFQTALDALKADADLINRVLEITLIGDEIDIRRYALPEE